MERESRFGSKFIACTSFPKCKYAEFDNSNNLLDENCPECGAKLIKRFNKKGQQFIGCSSYPNCKYIKKND
ncbi:topoisomerase DNA-binding C4 zinc finger domain-containing protein [bacterium]|nr:topoisomerase DNA-binding C4 zinc finger domain-containing protein [bacterium]